MSNVQCGKVLAAFRRMVLRLWFLVETAMRSRVERHRERQALETDQQDPAALLQVAVDGADVSLAVRRPDRNERRPVKHAIELALPEQNGGNPREWACGRAPMN